MAEKPQRKTAIVYEIQTTPELEEAIYSTTKIRITGQFVKFKPFLYKTRFETSRNEQGTVVILPARAIKRIFKHRITAEMIRKELEQQK